MESLLYFIFFVACYLFLKKIGNKKEKEVDDARQNDDSSSKSAKKASAEEPISQLNESQKLENIDESNQPEESIQHHKDRLPSFIPLEEVSPPKIQDTFSYLDQTKKTNSVCNSISSDNDDDSDGNDVQSSDINSNEINYLNKSTDLQIDSSSNNKLIIEKDLNYNSCKDEQKDVNHQVTEVTQSRKPFGGLLLFNSKELENKLKKRRTLLDDEEPLEEKMTIDELQEPEEFEVSQLYEVKSPPIEKFEIFEENPEVHLLDNLTKGRPKGPSKRKPKCFLIEN